MLLSIAGTFLVIGLAAVIYDYFGRKAEKKAKKQT